MPKTQSQLFLQIVSDTKKLIRLQCQQAQDHLSVDPQIQELKHGIAIKQALLEGHHS